MSFALWSLSLTVLFGSAKALVSDEYVAHTVSAAQKSVSVNSVGAIGKAQNSLLRQERQEHDTTSADVDADLTKLLGSEPSASGTKTADADQDLKLLGSDFKTQSSSGGADADLTKLIGSESSVASQGDVDLKKLETNDMDTKSSDSNADLQKLQASFGQTSDANGSDTDLQKIQASLGQTLDTSSSIGSNVATKSDADFDLDKELADLNKGDKGTSTFKDDSLDSLLSDLKKESKDTADLNKDLETLDDNKGKGEADEKKVDSLMASMDSSSKDLSDSLSQLKQMSSSQSKPNGLSLLQLTDMPGDSNLAILTNDGTKSSDSDLGSLGLSSNDGTKSDIDKDLAQMDNEDQNKQTSSDDHEMEKVMANLAKESKDNADLDNALKKLESDDSEANDQKNANEMKDISESLNELNKMKTSSLVQIDDLQDQAKRAKDSKWLDDELAKVGDGWHPPKQENGAGDMLSSFVQNSHKDSEWLDDQIKQHGDKIDPAANSKWIDDELERIQSKKQDDAIAKMAQQQLNGS